MSNELNDKIKLAIEFLNDTNVKMSSMENKVQFLKSKGLNDDEINMALSYGNFNNSIRFNNSSYGNYGFELQRDWRDYFIIGVVSSGLAYGLGTLAKKYLWPHLQPPTSSQYESDLKVLNDKYDEADKLLKNLNDDTQSIKQSLKGQQDKVNETISEIEHSIQSIKLGEVKTRDEMNDIVKDINEIKSQLPALIQSSQQSQSQSLNELKSELKSLKSLLLSRQSSTGASNINSNGNGNISPSSSIQIGKPSIPAWQLANNNPTTNNDKDNKDHENTELLTSRKSGFGVVWIAATLSTKTSLKKFTKKDLLSFSIPKFCETLQNPPEPLALRLSSSLLFGLVRIFDKRIHLFQSQVQQLNNELEKAMFNFDTVTNNMNLNLSSGLHRSKRDQITIETTTNDQHSIDLNLLIDIGDLQLEEQVPIDDSLLASLSSFERGSGSFSFGVDRGRQHSDYFDIGLGDDLMQLDFPHSLTQSVDSGLHYSQSSRQFTQDRSSIPKFQQMGLQPELQQRQSQLLDDWGMPIEEIRRDFFDDAHQSGLGDDFFNFETPIPGEFQQQTAGKGRISISSKLTTPPPLHEHEREKEHIERPTKRRKILIDDRLQLNDDELRNNRFHYFDNMKVLNDYKKTSNILKEYETLSRNLIFENANFNIENEILNKILKDADVRIGEVDKTIQEQKKRRDRGNRDEAYYQSEREHSLQPIEEIGRFEPVEDVEMGRRTTQSPPRDTLPWEVSHDLTGIDQPFHSSPSGSIQRTSSFRSLSQRFSLDPSLSVQQQQLTLRSPQLSALGIDTTSDRFSFGELDDAFHQKDKLTFEKQTNQFLTFIKDLMDSGGGTGTFDENTNTNTLTMNDICPPKLSTRYVAAQAFQNILILADKSIVNINVENDDPSDFSLSVY